jgi:hypothetical protein
LSVENPQLTATIFNQSSFAQTAQPRWRTVASRERQSVAPVSLTTRAGTINPMSPRAAKARSCCDQMDCLTKNNSVETIATADQASSLQMCHPSA